jgi:hypothetical protein
MGNKTNGTTKHEKTVEDTHLHVVLSLFLRESAAIAHEVDEADSDTTVDIKDEIVLLGGGDSLDSKSIVEELSGREVGLDELLDELDTKIGVVAGLDAVTNTGD